MITMRYFFYLFVSLSLQTTLAASAVNNAIEPLTFYDIEVVVFERFGQGNDEFWPEDPGKPDISLAAKDFSSNLKVNKKSLLPPVSGLKYQQPKEKIARLNEDHQFDAIASTLKRKGAVVHSHLRWRQAVEGRDSLNWLLIGSKRLKGLLRVSKGRFLHIDTDLLLKDPKPINASLVKNSPSSKSDFFTNFTSNNPLTEEEPVESVSQPSYRIQLHRRMRSGETHYIDHPKVGIIIRADRYEIETEPVEEIVDQPIIPTTPTATDKPVEDPDAGSTPRALPDPT